MIKFGKVTLEHISNNVAVILPYKFGNVGENMWQCNFLLCYTVCQWDRLNIDFLKVILYVWTYWYYTKYSLIAFECFLRKRGHWSCFFVIALLLFIENLFQQKFTIFGSSRDILFFSLHLSFLVIVAQFICIEIPIFAVTLILLRKTIKSNRRELIAITKK